MATKTKEAAKPFFKQAQLYTTTAQINDAIAKAVKSANTVQLAYQKIACSAIVHLHEHKDIRVIRNLLDTMPEGLRKVAMATFFDRYAQVRFDDEGQAHYDATKKTQLGLALEKAWWKTVKESVYTPFVFQAEVQKLIDRAEARFTKGVDTSKGDKLNIKQIAALKALIAPKRKVAKAA